MVEHCCVYRRNTATSDQWNSVEPLAGLCIVSSVCACMYLAVMNPPFRPDTAAALYETTPQLFPQMSASQPSSLRRRNASWGA